MTTPSAQRADQHVLIGTISSPSQRLYLGDPCYFITELPLGTLASVLATARTTLACYVRHNAYGQVASMTVLWDGEPHQCQYVVPAARAELGVDSGQMAFFAQEALPGYAAWSSQTNPPEHELSFQSLRRANFASPQQAAVLNNAAFIAVSGHGDGVYSYVECWFQDMKVGYHVEFIEPDDLEN